jgi:hypothetical protein
MTCQCTSLAYDHFPVIYFYYHKTGQYRTGNSFSGMFCQSQYISLVDIAQSIFLFVNKAVHIQHQIILKNVHRVSPVPVIMVAQHARQGSAPPQPSLHGLLQGRLLSAHPPLYLPPFLLVLVVQPSTLPHSGAVQQQWKILQLHPIRTEHWQNKSNNDRHGAALDGRSAGLHPMPKNQHKMHGVLLDLHLNIAFIRAIAHVLHNACRPNRHNPDSTIRRVPAGRVPILQTALPLSRDNDQTDRTLHLDLGFRANGAGLVGLVAMGLAVMSVVEVVRTNSMHIDGSVMFVRSFYGVCFFIFFNCLLYYVMVYLIANAVADWYYMRGGKVLLGSW